MSLVSEMSVCMIESVFLTVVVMGTRHLKLLIFLKAASGFYPNLVQTHFLTRETQKYLA